MLKMYLINSSKEIWRLIALSHWFWGCQLSCCQTWNWPMWHDLAEATANSSWGIEAQPAAAESVSCQSTLMWAFPESSDMAVKLWDLETQDQVLLYRANSTRGKKCFVLFCYVSPSCSHSWEWQWIHLSNLIPSLCSAEHEITQLLEPWTWVSLSPLGSWFSLCSFPLVLLDSRVEQSKPIASDV